MNRPEPAETKRPTDPDFFGRAERLLIRVSLLILLAIGLAKIVIPEAVALTRYFYEYTEASRVTTEQVR